MEKRHCSRRLILGMVSKLLTTKASKWVGGLERGEQEILPSARQGSGALIGVDRYHKGC